MSESMPERHETAAGRRWLARASLATGVAAVVVVLVAAGVAAAGALILLVAAEALLVIVGAWMALAHRALARAAGLALIMAAVAGAIVIEAAHGLLWVVAVSAALLATAVLTGERALRPPDAHHPADDPAATPPQHAFLIMNPRSGGGK
ncbi:MAG TPA: diacylglycerol kinase, partial [Mycobacteriales bacterium]|nr:diacylglycerol kinase [Mycobacteriales bacterium]